MNGRRLVSMFAALVLGALAGGAATREEALAAKLAGDHERAIRLFSELIAAAPGDVELLFQLGTVQGWAGKYDEALATLGRAQAIDAGNVDVQMARGRVLAWSGRLAAGEKVFRTVAAQNPANLDAVTMLGRVLTWQRQFDAARATYAQVLAVNPHYTDALIGQGDLLRLEERFDEARSYYQRAEQVEPESESIRRRLASVRRAGRWRVDAGFEFSRFSGGTREDWQGWDAAARYAVDRRTGASLGVEHARRFGFTDVQYSVGVDRRFSDDFSGLVRLSATPAADFFARRMGAVGAVWRWRKGDERLPATLLLADYRAAAYGPGTAHSAWFGATQYVTSRVAVTAKHLVTRNLNRHWTDGWQLALEGEPSDEFRWRVGYADTKESLSTTVFDLVRELRTQTWFAGVHREFTPAFGLRVDLTHERVPGGSDRTACHVGLITRF